MLIISSIPVFGSQKWEDLEFEDSLGYLVKPPQGGKREKRILQRRERINKFKEVKKDGQQFLVMNKVKLHNSVEKYLKSFKITF